MDLAKHTILNNSFRDAKMPGGPQVSKTSRYAITASPVERQGSIPKSCKYCCDMRGLRNERFAKSEVQYNPDLVSTNIVSNLSTFFDRERVSLIKSPKSLNNFQNVSHGHALKVFFTSNILKLM